MNTFSVSRIQILIHKEIYVLLPFMAEKIILGYWTALSA